MHAVYGRRLSALWRWRDRRPTHRGPLQPVSKTVIMLAPTSIFSGSDIDDHWRLKASPLRSIAGIGQGGSSDTTTVGRAGQSGAIGRGITTRRALAVQLKACEAVSEIITRAIQDGQSDGTYTALAWSRSRE